VCHKDNHGSKGKQKVGNLILVKWRFSMIDYNDKNYEKYGTKEQLKALKLVRKHGSVSEAARAEGVTSQGLGQRIKRLKQRAARSGYIPENGMTEPFDESLNHLKSTVHVKDGKVVQYWARMSPDEEKKQEIAKKAIKEFCKSLPKIKPTKYKQRPSSELLAAYPLGDPHIGMMAWGEETGQDWDLKIAESSFISVFDRLGKSAPPCEQGVIFNLGDYFHADNLKGMTERSGHVLDLDGRYAKMVKVGMRIMRYMIHSALEHHETVKVVNSIGNHDDTASMFLSIALAEIYEKEKRVIIDDSPTPCHYIRHGKVLIGSHHGHTIKPNNLPSVMATDKAKDWGETEFRYFYTGHVHHDQVKEYPGCKFESFRILPPKDAYATWHGYRAMSDCKAIVHHCDHGEIERHTVNLGMLQ